MLSMLIDYMLGKTKGAIEERDPLPPSPSAFSLCALNLETKA